MAIDKMSRTLLENLGIDPEIMPKDHDSWGCNLWSFYFDYTDGIMYHYEIFGDETPEELAEKIRCMEEEIEYLREQVMEYIDEVLAYDQAKKDYRRWWAETASRKAMVDSDTWHELWSETW